MERLLPERLKIIYSKEKMKESSYLVTSMKIQKYRAAVLQLLDMHNLKRELITEHVRQTCDVHKP